MCAKHSSTPTATYLRQRQPGATHTRTARRPGQQDHRRATTGASCKAMTTHLDLASPGVIQIILTNRRPRPEAQSESPSGRYIL